MRDDFGAFGGGMNAVGLNCSGHVDQVFVDHGNESNVVARGEIFEELTERLDVIGPVVGRQRDAGEQEFDVRGLKPGEHLVEVAAGLLEGKSSKPVVAAKLHDHDFRVETQDSRKPSDSVFSSSSAGAMVDDLVVVAFGIEQVLQRVGKRLTRSEAATGGYAVAIANKNMLCSEERDSSEEQGN